MAVLEGVVILLLLLLNGFLAMSEMAIVSARRGRLERLSAGGHAEARIALGLAEDPSRCLAAVQMGMTLIGILAGALSGVLIADRLEDWLDAVPAVAPYAKPVAIAIVVVCVTYVSLVIGELVPKQIALKDPEAIALRVARPLAVFTRLAAPPGWALDRSTKAILRLMKLRPGFERTVTDEDIQGLIRRAERLGVLHKIEREMVEGVLDLENRAVRTIMTPRPDIAWIDLDGPNEAMVKTIRDCPYAQLLASRGAIDEMAGIIRKQDLLEQLLAETPLAPEKLLQPPLVVPEGVSILHAIDLFRKTPVNTAVVVDEYGTIQGLVTRTDLLEAVAGDLPDVDVEREPQVVHRDDGSLLIDAAIAMSDIVGLNGFHALPPGDFVTLAGFVLARLGRLPKTGDEFVWNGWRFQVAAMDGRRIDKVLARPA
jgi:putative hemolysin